MCNDEELEVLTLKDIEILEGYVKTLYSNMYLEWSIAKMAKYTSTSTANFKSRIP